jgi:hypothetical protein
MRKDTNREYAMKNISVTDNFLEPFTIPTTAPMRATANEKKPITAKT